MAAKKSADPDAYSVIMNTLKSYGLGSLSSLVWGYLQKGYSSDRVQIEIQQSPQWKQRFSANEQRKAKGLPVLSPADYLSTESAYRQVMQAAGLPPGFYDKPSDFTKWIATDVSPTEVQERAQSAQKLVESLDPNVLKDFQQFYTKGDIVAYALDPKRTTDLLNRQVAAAQTAAAAQTQGLNVSKTLSEQIADTGVSPEQARQGFEQSALTAQQAKGLSAVYGGSYTTEDAIKDTLLGDANAQRKLKTLASKESAAFAGTTGVGQSSLGKQSAGQL